MGRDFVELQSQIALKPGDGIVFDTGGDTNSEQGGRIFEIKGNRLFFQRGHIDFARDQGILRIDGNTAHAARRDLGRAGLLRGGQPRNLERRPGDGENQ